MAVAAADAAVPIVASAGVRSTLLLGCDFTCAPRARKPIVMALGHAVEEGVQLLRFERFETLDGWAAWLAHTPAWTGAFDLPFSLPRELVQSLGWPTDWQALMAHYAALTREQIRSRFAAFCAARPVGGKFAHRATDGPAGSSPSMKWVNPPVAFMLHAGVPRLIDAGAFFPALQHRRAADPAPRRVALEAYPGLLARAAIGRTSYKNDAGQGAEPRRQARERILEQIEAGEARTGLRLLMNPEHRERMRDDPQGDHLDAGLCLLQAAWCHARRDSTGPGWGLPQGLDALEGWIAGA